MTTNQIVALALQHKGNNPSAILCAQDANHYLLVGEREKARFWGLRSLKHSLGILSPVYQEAVR